MSIEQTTIDSSALDKLLTLKTAATAERRIGQAHLMLVPPQFKVEDVTDIVAKNEPAPKRKQGTASLGNIESLIRYCKDQQHNASGYIYADPDALTITAVFNDHQSDAPGWRDFRAVFKAEASRELAQWRSQDRQPLEQEAFAIFLEDHIADVIEPAGADLLAIALTLEAKVDVNFASARRLDNGQVQLTYNEVIDARASAGSITIPREFKLGIRLFKNAAPWKINARFKYRLAAGKVKFWYELDRIENAVEQAFTEYVDQVKSAGYPVLIGKP